MDSFSNYSLQSVHVDRLKEEFSTGRFTHSYLFTGPEGTGKKSVARLCAQTALCRGDKKPCGECGPCRRFLAGTHPDFHVLEPEAGKREISVRQMREMLKLSEMHSFEDGVKVFFIPNADRMNAASQNVLLKTLEEPPEGTVFLLVTVHSSALLPTVVSRCRSIRFHPLSDEQTTERLRQLGMDDNQIALRTQMADGCVGQALALKDEVIQMREEIAHTFFSVHSIADLPVAVNRYKDEKNDKRAILDLLEEIVREVMCVQSGSGQKFLLPQDARAYADHVPLSGGIDLRDRIIEGKKMIASNVNFQAVLETVLLKIAEEYQKWPW